MIRRGLHDAPSRGVPSSPWSRLILGLTASAMVVAVGACILGPKQDDPAQGDNLVGDTGTTGGAIDATPTPPSDANTIPGVAADSSGGEGRNDDRCDDGGRPHDGAADETNGDAGDAREDADAASRCGADATTDGDAETKG